jgi:hypothetical protein
MDKKVSYEDLAVIDENQQHCVIFFIPVAELKVSNSNVVTELKQYITMAEGRGNLTSTPLKLQASRRL